MTEYMNVIIHSVKEWVNTKLGSYVQKGDVDGKLVPPLSADGSDAGKTIVVDETGTSYELVTDNSSERIDSVVSELGAFKEKVSDDLSTMQADVDADLNTLKTTIAGDIATAKEQAIAEANNAANAVKNDLLSGAGEAYDTLKELGELIDENVDAIAALEAVATGKADKGHAHSWGDLNDKPFYATESESNVIIFNGAPLFNDNTAEIESDYFSKDRELIMIDELGEEHPIVNRGFIDPHGGDFEGYYVWGNAALVPYFDGEDTGETWAFITNYSVKEVTDVKLAKVFTSDDSVNGSQWQVTLAYFGWHTDVHYLDEMFIPDSIARAGNIMSKENPTGTGSFSMNRRTDMPVGDYSHVEGMYNYASGYASHAEGYGAAASNYYAHAEGYNTTASGYASHAEGYYPTASGSYAHAEGYQTTASGQASHAEGDQSVASEYRAHAEGYYTNASGMNAHAEGYRSKASGNTSHSEGYETEASGAKSHAEGEYSKAIGDNSHAEGYQTTANKEYTHAEGAYTVADGRYSHVEGYTSKTSGLYSHAEGFYTEAAGEAQHVQGKYNIVDTEGEYAHIVGNGDYDARSNAHTLDWDGNAWYAGNLKVGGTSYEDADEVALKSDIVTSWDNLEDKPFGEVTDWTLVIAEATYANNSMLGSWANTAYSQFRVAGTYRFTIDGTDEYVYEKTMSGVSFPVGDSSFVNYPFCTEFRGNHYIKFKDGASHTLKVEFLTAMSKPIDEVYIPDTIARVAYVDNCMSAKADVNHVHAFADLQDKPFGEIAVQVEDDPSLTVALTTITASGQKVNGNVGIGSRSIVRFDGKLYECDYVQQGEVPAMITYYGNLALCDAGDDNGLPFCLKRQNNNTYCYVADESTSHTVEAFVGRIDILRLGEKFISTAIARTADVEAQFATKADVEHKHAWDELDGKPFGEEFGEIVILENLTYAQESVGYKNKHGQNTCSVAVHDVNATALTELGKTYKVVYNGKTYVLESIEDSYGGCCIGNSDYWEIDDEIPFSIRITNQYGGGKCADLHLIGEVGDTHTFTISEYTNQIKQLDEKYIPETIARTAKVTTAVEEATAYAKAYTDERISTHKHVWEDLIDKPFGDIVNTSPVLNELALSSYDYSENAVSYYMLVRSDAFVEQLVEGETYFVTLDGEKYELVAESYDGNVYIGNYWHKSMDIGSETGLPFAVVNYSDWALGLYYKSNKRDSVITVVKKSIEVKTLDETYIPDSISRTNHEHSWEDLTDKPFGEGESIDITWDGDISQIETMVVKNDYTAYCYVSDLTPSNEQMSNAMWREWTKIDLDQELYPFEQETQMYNEDYFFAPCYMNHVVVVRKDNVECDGLVFPKAGIYFGWSAVLSIEHGEVNAYINCLVISGNIQTLDDKFISSSIARVSDVSSKITTALSDYYTKPEVEVFHDEIKDYVDDEVAALVNAAPETLDTIGELAAAFAENKEVVDALDASITNKQDKVSDTLILVDTVTGKQHKLQIQNGQLVSFPIEE